jgi:hypothetical protein
MIGTEQVEGLVGKSIQLVCFAQYSVYIHFEGDVLLTVEAGFEHIHKNIRHVHEASSPFEESNLMTILESAVASASLDANGDLHLTFSNGDSLSIYKDPEFESYRIKIRGKESIA